jgi:hypothetical protein
MPDLLYNIFEHHLFNALVEDETADEFLGRVVKEYLGRLTAADGMIPRDHIESVETDLREEVLEMLRKKTYGHFNLAEFRKAHSAAPLVKPEPRKKARRTS